MLSVETYGTRNEKYVNNLESRCLSLLLEWIIVRITIYIVTNKILKVMRTLLEIFENLQNFYVTKVCTKVTEFS